MRSGTRGINGSAFDNSAEGSGAVYLFLRTGTTWTQHAYLKASNAGPFDSFGFGCTLSGDLIGVSAINEAGAGTGVNSGLDADDSLPTSGAAYVFR